MKSKEEMMLLLKFQRLLKSKRLFLKLSMLIDTFKTLLKRLLKFQSLLNKSNKLSEKMKRSLKLETNMRLLNKLNQLSKKQLLSKNSNKSLETSIILKKFFKSLTDMNKPQLKFQFKKKNLLKFHISSKRLSKKLLLCHKSFKS